MPNLIEIAQPVLNAGKGVEKELNVGKGVEKELNVENVVNRLLKKFKYI